MDMNRIWLLGLMALFVLASCNKQNKEDDETLEITAEDQAMAEGAWDDVGEQSEGSSESAEAGENEWDACAVITVDSVGTPFPLAVTVDFGEGCTGRDGRVRRGKLRYTLTGWMRNEGSSLTITPEGYFVDDYQVEGTRSNTNLGLNGEGNMEYEVVVKNAVVTDPDGRQVTWNSTRKRTWVEGRNTGFFTPNGNGGFLRWEGITDDVYEITGTANGTNRNGIAYDVEITSPLRVQLDCRWITRGTIELRPEGVEARVFDYGEGECDNKATLTTSRKEREITLGR